MRIIVLLWALWLQNDYAFGLGVGCSHCLWGGLVNNNNCNGVVLIQPTVQKYHHILHQAFKEKKIARNISSNTILGCACALWIDIHNYYMHLLHWGVLECMCWKYDTSHSMTNQFIYVHCFVLSHANMSNDSSRYLARVRSFWVISLNSMASEHLDDALVSWRLSFYFISLS